MKILFDKNNILSIQPDVASAKEYTQTTGGYTFSDTDKGLLVVHKKEIKIVHLKDLGENMSVVYMNKNKIISTFNKDACKASVTLFSGFDEKTGKTHYFIPKCSEEKKNQLETYRKKLGIDLQIEKTNIGSLVQGSASLDDGKKDTHSFLFGLLLIYGKLDIKQGMITGAKIQIPLFGQYLQHQELLDNILKNLEKEGIFVNKSIVKNTDGIIYQISCGDYQLLKIFASYYNSIEKSEKIHKEEELKMMKEKLILFIQENEQIPQEGKKEVIQNLQTETIKLLTK